MLFVCSSVILLPGNKWYFLEAFMFKDEDFFEVSYKFLFFSYLTK